LNSVIVARFINPVFKPLESELNGIVNAAWDAYSNFRKSPVTRKAGRASPIRTNEISVDWLAAREAILAAQRQLDDASEKPRILLINGKNTAEELAYAEGFCKQYLPLAELRLTFGRDRDGRRVQQYQLSRQPRSAVQTSSCSSLTGSLRSL
jgi:hypothetical protein